MSEDPLLRLLTDRKNLQLLGLVIAAVACGWYIYAAIQEQALASRRLVADTFSSVRQQYAQLVDIESKLQRVEQNAEANVEVEKAELEVKLGEARAKLEEILKSMADSGAEYEKIANLYRASADLKMDNLSVAKAHLLKFEQSKIQNSSSKNDFLTEVAMLMLARQLLDQQDGDSEARQMLSALVKNGRYVNASAAYSLALVSKTDQQKKEAFAVISEFISKHPEQAELLDAELKSVVVATAG
jgi:predicted ribosome quality control (RQC) complex YloA/Tae2 family protein